MKLAGRSHLAIHRGTGLYRAVAGYTGFFSNVSYAGYRKCGKLVVPNTHPAYVSKQDFDRIQALRQPHYGKADFVEHPRRRQEDNPFVLSGLLYCGYCGGAMVGNTNGQARNYRCLRRARSGSEACVQHSSVAYWLHRAVCDWVSQNVLSLDHFFAAREEVNRRLTGARREVKQRKADLTQELGKTDRGIKHLLDALEVSGFREIGERLGERKAERERVEAELHQLSELDEIQGIEISDEALVYLAEHLSEELTSGNPSDVKSVLRKVLRRVELYEDRVAVHYVSPILSSFEGEKVGLGLDFHRGLGGT